jgi:hypothetical protein
VVFLVCPFTGESLLLQSICIVICFSIENQSYFALDSCASWSFLEYVPIVVDQVFFVQMQVLLSGLQVFVTQDQSQDFHVAM